MASVADKRFHPLTRYSETVEARRMPDSLAAARGESLRRAQRVMREVDCGLQTEELKLAL